VDIHDKDDRRGLWEAIDKFKTGSKLQGNTLICGADIRELGVNNREVARRIIQNYTATAYEIVVGTVPDCSCRQTHARRSTSTIARISTERRSELHIWLAGYRAYPEYDQDVLGFLAILPTYRDNPR
jgi:hypothetical protein